MATKILITLLLTLIIPAQAQQPNKKIYVDGLSKHLYFNDSVIMDFSNNKTAPKQTTKLAIKNISAISTQRKISPIFTDSPTGNGSKKALPGGVIVKFSDDLREDQIEQWAEEKGYNISKHKNGRGKWIVETDAGLPCLEVAKRLQQDPIIKSATLNWWIEIFKR